MKPMIAGQAKSLIVILIAISICYGQSQRGPRRRTPTRISAPFLQNAKSYEETPYVTKVVLKNGVTVLVEENGIQPIVSIQAYIHAGFWDEPAKDPGLASLLAAMVCRGTGDQNAGTLRQQLQMLGGFFNCSMDYANTRFEITLPSSQWKKALEIQADALFNPSLNQSNLVLEANLITDEARGILDDPSEFAREKLLELGFGQPRMAEFSTLAGSALGNLKSESLVEFHKAMYRPEEMTLIISGDIRSSDILNEVARIYNMPYRGGPKQVEPPAETKQEEFRYRAIRGNVALPRVLLGFHTVSERAEDYRALEILTAILGSGEGSVFVSRLRDQKGLILKEETKLASFPDFGYLVIQTEVDPKHIDLSEIALLTEIELLKRDEPNQADMVRAVSQLERSYWKGLETATGRAQALEHFESLGDWKQRDHYISELRQVKPSDVKRVANRYLRLENCSLLEYLPATGEERNLSTDTVRKTLEGLLGPSADQEQEAREKEVVPAIRIPSGNDSFKFSEIQYPFQLASILRGPDMFIREDHTAPMIDLGLFFPSGKLAENKENAGITEFMVNMMLRGSKDQSGTHFHRQLEIYGGQIEPVVTDDYFGFYFSILSRNFGEGFDLLREAIKSPGFDKDEIVRQKKIQAASILDGKFSVSYAGQRMKQSLFKDYSYSLDSKGTEESLAGITEDSLQGWFNTYVKNRKPIVVAIGDTIGTSMASYFVQHFSGSRMKSTNVAGDYVKPLEKGESIEQSWGNSQSLILIGFRAPPEDDEDGYATTILQNYAGGLGSFSREIRDRLGIAYDISVSYRPRLRGGSMVTCAAATLGNEDAVLKSLREEMAHIIADPITERDFRSAVNAAVGAYRINNQARFTQISDIVENVLAGKGIDGYQNFMTGLQEVTEEDLREVARRIFNMDKAVILRMHGQSRW
jgi:zinc protease